MSGDNDSRFYVWRDNTDDLRNDIIKNEEENAQEKVNYNIMMHEKRYLDAAKIAFDGNYSSSFIKALSLVYNRFSE